MTEIQFLVQLMLDSTLSEDAKKKIADRITAIENERQAAPVFVPNIINTPYIGQVDPCLHEYPTPWHATVPPHCKKCGKQAAPYTFTCSTTAIPFWDKQ